jgi:hypothetical protein
MTKDVQSTQFQRKTPFFGGTILYISQDARLSLLLSNSAAINYEKVPRSIAAIR